jgi:hypothetical protein
MQKNFGAVAPASMLAPGPRTSRVDASATQVIRCITMNVDEFPEPPLRLPHRSRDCAHTWPTENQPRKASQRRLMEYRPPRRRPQGGSDNDAADAHSDQNRSLGFHPESPRLEAMREVKELLDDASNEGSDVRRRRHRRHRPRSMQCFRAEFTKPKSMKFVQQTQMTCPPCSSPSPPCSSQTTRAPPAMVSLVTPFDSGPPPRRPHSSTLVRLLPEPPLRRCHASHHSTSSCGAPRKTHRPGTAIPTSSPLAAQNHTTGVVAQPPHAGHAQPRCSSIDPGPLP